MSAWTHVAGIVRLDTFHGVAMDGTSDAALDDMIRRAFSAEPEGSEGPLTVRVVLTREYNSVCWGFASIEGDLRDYASADPVVRWLTDAVARLWANQIIVRQAAVEIDVEGERGITIVRTGATGPGGVVLALDVRPRLGE